MMHHLLSIFPFLESAVFIKLCMNSLVMELELPYQSIRQIVWLYFTSKVGSVKILWES